MNINTKFNEMKKQIFIGFLMIIIAVIRLPGQEKTDYSTITLDNLNDSWSVSSTYWLGETYAFFNEWGSDEYLLGYARYDVSEIGTVHAVAQEILEYNIQNAFEVTSCVYLRDLYVFYWLMEDQPAIHYYRLVHNAEPHHHSLPVNEHISDQMAAVTLNDTIYVFFADDADNKVKYYRSVFEPAFEALRWVGETPVELGNGMKSIGNVAAITHVNNDLKEEIMVAFPGEPDDKGNNKLNIVTGRPGAFELSYQQPCVQDYPIGQVSMAQGSVKGASTGSYNVQFGYNVANNSSSGPQRCELNLTTGEFGDWESIAWPGDLFFPYTCFMEFYNKQPQKRQKFLAQVYNHGSGNMAALWKSDRLKYRDEISEVPPLSLAATYFDIVAVVEGAPPYALNGYQLGDDMFNNNPLSEFNFTQENTNSVSASTTYTQSIEANMGIGPVTAGFKASFMESTGTTSSETISITKKINPPLSNLDSAGMMWYYYIAPTVVRSRWVMEDYNGGDIEPKRTLFFFHFKQPQMKTMLVNLSEFGENSPRAYDLESYENRGVENMSGMEKILRNETDIDIQAGGSGSLELTFSNSETQSHSETYEVSLGIDADLGIFSASAEATAGFECSYERTTTFSNSFYINWNLFAPKYPEDTANIRSYTPVSYVMKTTDGSAYYLPDSLNEYRPYFITYEVNDLNHGDFLFGMDENALRESYRFVNYPVPCSDFTHFSYQLDNSDFISLDIYNALGHLIRQPVQQMQYPGKQKLTVRTSDLAEGIYFYRLQIGDDLLSGKLIVDR